MMMVPPVATREQDYPDYMVTEAMILSRDWSRRQAPFFRVEEVAKVFFGMSASWLRLRANPDADHPETWFTHPDGRRIEFRRADPEKADSARVFLLSDIEPMAYSLYKYGRITAARLTRILQVVQAIAQIYGLFDDPEAAEVTADDEPEAAEGAGDEAAGD